MVKMKIEKTNHVEKEERRKREDRIKMKTNNLYVIRENE
jgi:hypothetical protein